MSSKVRVTLIKSLNGRLEAHKQCAAGLGLRKIHQSREVLDSTENRGMINKIAYMLKIEEV